MTAVRSDSRGSRTRRWMTHNALRVAYCLAIYFGFMLLFVPILDVVGSPLSLLLRKIIITMGSAVVVAVLGFGLLLAGIRLRRRLLELQQAKNDRIAQGIMSDLRADPAAPVAEFYLYLRAFETTGKLRIPLYLRLLKIYQGAYQLVTDDLESYVSKAVRGAVPMIALGQPGEAIGAGRIVTQDKDWEADIVPLMKRAKGILMVPSERPGTLWEIDTLKHEGLLSKVLFIMPPRTKGKHDTRERWEAARQAMASRGLEAPEHQQQGLLFELGPDGKVSNVEPLLLRSTRQVRKSLERILSDAVPKGGLYKAIAVADKRARRAAFVGWASALWQFSFVVVTAVALFVGHPDVGFRPQESWATVWDRTSTMMTMSDMEAGAEFTLTMSPQYRAIAARFPAEKTDALRSDLIRRGLWRLDDENVLAFVTAWGDMMARLDAKTCAALYRGEITRDEVKIAYSYIPPERIEGFLIARVNAIRAAAQGPWVPSSDAKAMARAREESRKSSERCLAARQQLLSRLSPEDQQRYKRLEQTLVNASDEDLAWGLRVMWGNVAKLPKPLAAAWARMLTTTMIPADDSTRLWHASQPAARR